MAKIIIKGGYIVRPDEFFVGDIEIIDGKITKILKGEELRLIENTDLIDAKGKYILPGLIDAHVHFRTPGAEQKEDWLTGSKAALAGGVTTVFDMPNTNPPTINRQNLELKRNLVKEKSLINYGFYAGAALDNLNEVKNFEDVVAIKIYMGSSTGNLLVDDLAVLEGFVSEAKPILAIHAESEACLEHTLSEFKGEFTPSIHSKLRPPRCAEEALRNILNLALKYKKRIHICHCSTELELKVVDEFLKRGFPKELITIEVTPHHLFLSDKIYESLGNFARVNPPLRSESDRLAMWKGIENGLVTMIATDHAPHLKSEKEQEYLKAPSGLTGVQTMLPLLLNAVNESKLSILDIANLNSFAPAKSFNVASKGLIEVGYDADLAVIDLDKLWTIKNENIYSKCGWTPFANMNVKGRVEKTLVNGNLMFDYIDGINDYFGDHLGSEVTFSR